MSVDMTSSSRGPNLYEFLLEAELAHYYDGLKNELKVASVAQLKYVEEEDLLQMGMTRPEQRRLRKYFQKYYPQTYLGKFKKMILPKKGDESDRTSVHSVDATIDRNSVRVPSKHIISADSIVINKELGVGEFGVVQQGVWTNEDGERIQVAIKCLSKERMQNNPMEFLKEAAIMHTIDHEHIVRLYGVVLDTNALMLVTELAPLRSLLECLKEPALRSSFPVISLCEFAVEICDGMQYLESKRLIHRDLAARNILVFAKNKVKISDFGLSRALGVGKDYYQTNFNVNLKLPIAWCAPECINYLKFTSASDVWAFGVTLWEMFSYGFQPWAALTGQQILEAIDEPNFQRLEQPECCPKDYYALMLKCWQHESNKRPKFSDILQILPDCKPEQVQAVEDSAEMPASLKHKKDWLQYKVGDVITVLDKRPAPDCLSVWKGVLNNGKTGLFNPANTIAYLGHNLPTNRPNFSRPDSKTGIYSSRRRLRAEMISKPQGDFKHTGHVGLDGAFFGDISFLGEKIYHQLPKQVVAPYKPQDDKEQSSLSRASFDSSDRTPLLTKSCLPADGKSGPALEVWSESGGERKGAVEEQEGDELARKVPDRLSCKPGQFDHEYHEISDEEDAGAMESPRFECIDLGPSLMDEVFKALGSTRSEFEFDEQQMTENNNVKNEIKEITAKVIGKDAGSKKKQATVKPISAADQHTLDSAIAMAKELASKSMLELDCRSDTDPVQESPKTPSSPTKRKFSFKFKSSPKTERRKFCEEAEAIPSIQDSITEEAKEAYNSLVEKGEGLEKPTLTAQTCHISGAATLPIPRTTHLFQVQSDAAETSDDMVDANPLRMLRSGVPVRPKVRGNKHSIPLASRASTPHSAAVARMAANANALPPAVTLTTISHSASALSLRSTLGMPPPPPPPSAGQKPVSLSLDGTEGRSNRESIHSPSNTSHSSESQSPTGEETGDPESPGSESQDAPPNPLPLPPRDRSKPLPVLKTHHRKHPLLIPVVVDAPQSDATHRPVLKQVSCPSVPFSYLAGITPLRKDDGAAAKMSAEGESANTSEKVSSRQESSSTTSSDAALSSTTVVVPPQKPARTYSLDDSFETQIQAKMDSLDDIPDEEAPSPQRTIYKSNDHVSCEDLLQFAKDKPRKSGEVYQISSFDSAEDVKRKQERTQQSRARGVSSDEVRIMQKMLAQKVHPEVCLAALDATDWDIHRAVKYVMLQDLLKPHQIIVANFKQALVRCNWHVQQAANYLIATQGLPEDTTEV